jgi:hypothetical protein
MIMDDILNQLDLETAETIAKAGDWNLKKEINKKLIELAKTTALTLNQLQFAFGYNPRWVKEDGQWRVAGVVGPRT